MVRFVLVHPPALSPAVWRPLAAALEAAGHAVGLPDYTPDLTVAGSWWRRATLATVKAVDALVGNPPPGLDERAGSRSYSSVAPGPDVLVLFSGSGVLAPAICGTRAPGTVVFVDATLPAAGGAETMASADVRRQVAALPRVAGDPSATPAAARGERLPRWTRWWPEADLAALLPDPRLRDELDRTAPELPADFYEEAIPAPAGWEPSIVRYLQLTGAYDAEAADARARGWQVVLPTETGLSAPTHLSVMTAPQVLVDLLT